MAKEDIRIEGLDDNPQALTKQLIWERKLLDFTLRNNLLNMRLGKRAVQLATFQLPQLEDDLQDGCDFTLQPYPAAKPEVQDDGIHHSDSHKPELEAQVAKRLKDHQLTSYLTEAELATAQKFIYRTARTAMEENGANSLFIAVGLLRWYETPRSPQPRHAPILLLPVEMVRKRGAQGYTLRKRDEEIQLNITLVELLKQQYNIDLGQLSPLPKDEKGVDVALILDSIRQAIRENTRWAVVDEAVLGLFSFNKFVMWNDIHTNAAKLSDNQVIATLMTNTLKWKDDTASADARQLDKTQGPQAFAIPLDVDSSQMEAVIESGEGKSFILHGPPGTGKSQTITNMIANALYQGKRVLFVAEKMAALSVVQKRLKKIGLEPFCLELHSNKVTKSHFLSQMQKALDAVHIQSPAEYSQTADRLFEHRKELIKYMEALHTKHASGFSLYDAISGYLAIEGEELKGKLPAVGNITPQHMQRWNESLIQLDTVFRLTGHPTGNPLFGLEPADSSSATQQQLPALLSQLRKGFTAMMPVLENFFQNELHYPISDLDDFDWALRLIESYKQANSHKTQILKVASQALLEENAERLQSAWKQVQDKGSVSKFFAQRSFMKDIHQYGKGITPENVDNLLEQLHLYQEAMQATIPTLLQEYANRHAMIAGAAPSISENALQQMNTLKEQYDAAWTQLAEKALISLPKEDVAQSIPACIDRWTDNLDQLKDWTQWTSRKRALEDEGLATAVSYIEEGHHTGEEASRAFSKTVYHQVILSMMDEDDSLRMFNGLLFEDIITKYRQETVRFQELTEKELYCRLAARIPSQTLEAANNSEMGILKRNIANGGRGTTIRKIIDQLPNLLPKLCPCMLMSPISVAQFLDIDSPKFDIVVFDEASQMPTSEAVGAIARGKALVVVGDPKQMPPTSFFETTQVDEEEAEYDDMDSILDDCIALSIPSHYLTWHYRSKHESLITFSNTHFYDSKLYTFPSIDDRLSKVNLIHVDGTYDKGHTRSNVDEAKAIVKEVVRRLSDKSLNKYSIGIVSFSKAQQDLIEDVLTDELSHHPELEDLAYHGEEPIFIKNLENVQGDERDIILFSVGYGPDQTGHVSMNFGPLNNEGGERRLNVAISRARYEMMIFSTLRPEQIDLKRTNAKGVICLKEFLEFAAKGVDSTQKAVQGDNSQEIMISQIAERLRCKGYQVDTAVGKSKFKVDIAVLNPKKADEYLLALLCDGPNYYKTKTTRDREICQPNVLRMLNWNVMRIWSIDWFENKDKVLERILKRLDDLQHPTQETPKEEVIAKQSFNIEDEQVLLSESKHNLPYQQAQIAEYKGKPSIEKVVASAAKLKEQVHQILDVEQPVMDNYIYKRIADAWKLTRVTTQLKEVVDQALAGTYQDTLSIPVGVYYWKNKDVSLAYEDYRTGIKRSIQEIPMIELMNAATDAISQQIAIPREDLKKQLAKLFGFTRRGEGATAPDAVMDRCIDQLISQGKLTEQEGKLMPASEE